MKWTLLLFSTFYWPAIGASTAALAGNVMNVTLGRAGMNVVIVFQEGRFDEGFNLIASGALETDPALVAPLIACIAHKGDRAVIADSRLFTLTRTIVITEGENEGCRGEVAIDDYTRD